MKKAKKAERRTALPSARFRPAIPAGVDSSRSSKSGFKPQCIVEVDAEKFDEWLAERWNDYVASAVMPFVESARQRFGPGVDVDVSVVIGRFIRTVDKYGVEHRDVEPRQVLEMVCKT